MVRSSGDTRRGGRFRVLALALTLSAMGALDAAAGNSWFLEEEIVRGDDKSDSNAEIAKTWLAPSMLRKEQGRSGSVTIVRKDLDLIWVLDPRKKSYFELTSKTLEEMGRQSMGAFMTATDEDPSGWLERTGRHKMVGDWKSYEVRMEDRPMPGLILQMWLSEAIPIPRELRDQLSGSLFGGTGPAAKLLEGLRELPGYPVEINLTMRLGTQRVSVTQRVTRVEEVEVDPKRFELPDGFKQVDSPFAAGPLPGAPDGERKDPSGK